MLPFVVEPIEIPYAGTFLPGDFYHVPKIYNHHENSQKNSVSCKGKCYESYVSSVVYPTLVAHGGFDSTLEELYCLAAAPALERGYNCLTFEGPGQGNVSIRQKLPFRHDWEKVVTPVLEFALSKNNEYNIDQIK